MAKKRGLAANRGLDALLGSIKKEKAITAVALKDDRVAAAGSNETQNANAKKGVKAKKDVNAKNNAAVTDSQTDESYELIRTTTGAKGSDTVKKQVANDKADKNHTMKGATANSNATSAHTVIADKQSSLDKQSRLDSSSSEDEMTLVQMDVSRLQAGKYQPRRDMSEPALRELADSIEQHGVMQPIVIRPLLAAETRTTPQVTHEIIAGERRWRAAKMANHSTIPAIERALSDELAIALALIENIQREDLSVIEQAEALQRFHTEFNMSHAMIAEVVGKARTTVSNLLRLNHLNETVKDYLSEGALDMGHARTLLSLSTEQQPIIAEKIIAASMTVREAEKLVKSILKPQPSPASNSDNLNVDIDKLNQKLSETLGATVKLKQKKGGKGSMEIFFHSEDELAGLLKYFK